LQKIVLATHNKHKIVEMNQILCDYPFDFKSLVDFPNSVSPDETGTTYTENALLKAKDAAAFTGLPSLSDDSGIEVADLDDRPGLYSARYGGSELNQAGKIQLLLSELEKTGSTTRRARFRCVIALVHPDGREWISEGVREGTITLQPKGEHGFGYDPIFWLELYAKSMAELTEATKNRISHRALALHSLFERLHKENPSYPQL
ncbi:unnamed protein product, partial [Phaeothamnion confervicola]